jgi:ribose 5-phosphate isomerase A
MAAGEKELHAIGERALEYVCEGCIVGLGTGRAATAFIHALGERVQAGLKVRGVPTSEESARLAVQLGIPLATLADVEAIDVDIDGADEVDPQCNLIKGYGGALMREKIVAAASKTVVILVGDEKLVPALGSRGLVPVEVLPFALPFCHRKLAALGFASELRLKDGKPFVTDNGNAILDCRVSALPDPMTAERAISAIPGVVGTGFFLGIANAVLISRGETVEVRQRSGG